jgi:hypothetical protein
MEGFLICNQLFLIILITDYELSGKSSTSRWDEKCTYFRIETWRKETGVDPETDINIDLNEPWYEGVWLRMGLTIGSSEHGMSLRVPWKAR